MFIGRDLQKYIPVIYAFVRHNEFLYGIYDTRNKDTEIQPSCDGSSETTRIILEEFKKTFFKRTGK